MKDCSRQSPLSLSRLTRWRGAFTLTELLVVLAVVVILVAVLLPVLRRAREAGCRIACAANLRTIGQAFILYAHEHNGALPTAYFGCEFRPESWIRWPPRGDIRDSCIYPYLRDSISKVMRCPSDDPESHLPCDCGPYPYSYTVNYWICGPQHARKLHHILRPATRVLAIDESSDTIDDSAFNIFETAFLGRTLLSDRHGGKKGNVLFADGHCGLLDRSLFGPGFPIAGEYFDPFRP